MKSLLIGLLSLFFAQEDSYDFSGNYTKNGNVWLVVDVRDGAYWVTFRYKNADGSPACELSEKARVKNGSLRIQIRQPKRPVSLQINREYNDGNTKMIVHGLKKSDQSGGMSSCSDSISLTGDYAIVR